MHCVEALLTEVSKSFLIFNNEIKTVIHIHHLWDPLTSCFPFAETQQGAGKQHAPFKNWLQ